MVAERFRSVVLVGAPGAGKGTQGKLLGQRSGYFHHSSGEVFRNLNPKSKAGSIFTEYSHRGELVPDRVTIDVWREDIERKIDEGVYDPARDLLVLDGIPRNANQATLMDAEVEVLRVIHLHATDEEKFIERLRQRALKENRADDAKEEVIRRRFEVYREETRPILEHYPPSLIADVEAVGTREGVLETVLGELEPIRQREFCV